MGLSNYDTVYIANIVGKTVCKLNSYIQLIMDCEVYAI